MELGEARKQSSIAALVSTAEEANAVAKAAALPEAVVGLIQSGTQKAAEKRSVTIVSWLAAGVRSTAPERYDGTPRKNVMDKTDCKEIADASSTLGHAIGVSPTANHKRKRGEQEAQQDDTHQSPALQLIHAERDPTNPLDLRQVHERMKTVLVQL